jgi:hypothetical protein
MDAGGDCAQLPKRAGFSPRSSELPQEICGFLALSYKTLFNFTICLK